MSLSHTLVLCYISLFLVIPSPAEYSSSLFVHNSTCAPEVNNISGGLAG